MSKQLTQKQINFCHKYIECGNASEAYRQCYDAAKMKPETIGRAACELMDNPIITTMIESLRAKASEVAVITVHDLLRELEEARALAVREAQCSAATGATMGKARLLGLDKIITENTTKHSFSGVSEEEIDARIKALASKL